MIIKQQTGPSAVCDVTNPKCNLKQKQNEWIDNDIFYAFPGVMKKKVNVILTICKSSNCSSANRSQSLMIV